MVNFWQKKWLAGLVLFLVSLLPRLTAVNRYITPDELIWVYRSVQFREALLAGAWADTLTTGHPGVITMWLGSLAISLQMVFSAESVPVYEWITHVAWYEPSNIELFPHLADFLSAGRVAVAVVNSAGLVGVWLLASRLWQSEKVAWFVAGLLALDPFVVGLSGLLHVDGLMTTFTLLSLLLLALTLKEADKRWVVLGAVTAVCAILSKSPALLLGIVWGVSFIWMRGRGEWTWGQFLRLGFLWVGVLLVALFVGFPALWSSPADVAELIQNNANRHIETALRPTFFMGEMAFEHGPLFYPVALLFRISPLVLLGLLLAGVRSWRGRVSGNHAVWLLWPVLFVLAITLAEKKFDRYALPAIPALIIMAGLGWHWGLHTMQKKQWLWAVLGVQLVWLLWALPYPLLAYNPLVGGLPAAEKVLTVGWGEGVSQAAHWLDEQAPNGTARAGLPLALAPFYASGETVFEGEAGYQIVTKTGVQADPDLLPRMMAEFELVQTFMLNGRPHAWLFFDSEAQPFQPSVIVDELPFILDGTIALHDRDVTVFDDDVWVTVLWERVADPLRYNVQINLLDISRAHTWYTLETALLNQTYFYPEHWAEGEQTAVTYKLPLPQGLPPATYLVDIKLFETETGRQTAVRHTQGWFYGMAIATSPFTIAPNTTTQIDPTSLNLPFVSDKTWGNLRLLGRDPLPASVATGGKFTLDLYWQATDSLPRNIQLQLQIGQEEPIAMPLSTYASEWWQAGDVIHEKYQLPVPVDIDAGETPLRLWVDDGGGYASAIFLDTLNIVTLDRLFTLPDNINVPLDVPFSDVMALKGMDESTIYVSPEEPLTLTLYWQVLTPPEELLNVFIHLIDENGQIVAQADRWPGGLPSDLWAEGQIIVDEYAISTPTVEPNEEFTLVIGLYDPATGVRLTPQTGLLVNDGRLFLPNPVFAEPLID